MINRRSAYVAAIALVLCIVGVPIFSRPYISFDVTHSFVRTEHEAMLLLQRGAPLEDIQDAVRASPYHVDEIAWIGTPLLSAAINEGRTDLALWLLEEQGADPNGVHPGTAPLPTAIGREEVDMVRILLEKGADPDLDMGGTMTPRSIAINTVKNEEIIMLLEDFGDGVD